MKYEIIGKPSHVAMVEFNGSLARAKKHCQPRTFSNGLPALATGVTFTRKRDAEYFLSRCLTLLAFQSGRIGHWITPTFVIVRK